MSHLNLYGYCLYDHNHHLFANQVDDRMRELFCAMSTYCLLNTEHNSETVYGCLLWPL